MCIITRPKTLQGAKKTNKQMMRCHTFPVAGKAKAARWGMVVHLPKLRLYFVHRSAGIEQATSCMCHSCVTPVDHATFTPTHGPQFAVSTPGRLQVWSMPRHVCATLVPFDHIPGQPCQPKVVTMTHGLQLAVSAPGRLHPPPCRPGGQ